MEARHSRFDWRSSPAWPKVAFLGLTLSGVVLRAEIPSVTVERQPPPHYLPTSADYLYYKKVTASRTTPDTYNFAVTLQGPLPEEFSEDKGAQYTLEADIDDEAGRNNPNKTGWSGSSSPLEIRLMQNPGSRKMYLIPREFEQRNKLWPVTISNYSRQENGFSFSVQSPFFAEGIRISFVLGSQAILRPFTEGRPGRAQELPSGQEPLDFDLTKSGNVTQIDQEPVPRTVAVATPSPTATPPPDEPITINRGTSEGSHSSHRRTTPVPSSPVVEEGEIPDYLCFKKVLATRVERSLTLTATLDGPLPPDLPPNAGVLYSFIFEPLPRAAGPYSVEVERAPKSRRFTWDQRPRGGNKSLNAVKVSSFTQTAEGFTATFTSPAFVEDASIRVRSIGYEIASSIAPGPTAVVGQGREGPVSSTIEVPPLKDATSLGGIDSLRRP